MWLKITGVLSAIIGVLMLVVRFRTGQVRELKESDAAHRKVNAVRRKQSVVVDAVKTEEVEEIEEVIEKAESESDRVSRFNSL